MEDRQVIIRLDVMLARRKMAVNELAAMVGCHANNLSIFKLGKGKAIKLQTLMRICTVLDCTPNDIIEFGPIVPASTPGEDNEADRAAAV